MENSKVAKYLNELNEKSKGKGNLIFRGVPDKTMIIQSSAARRLKDKNNQFDFIQYHTNLIDNVRRNHFLKGESEYEKIHDLEVLAEIQHHGGATCLTDFTTNFLIALWFASTSSVETKGKEKTVGRIYVIDINSSENDETLYTYKFKNSQKKTLDQETIKQILTKPRKYIDFKRNNDPRIWIWEPTMLNNRIIKQDSVFVFGLSVVDESAILSTIEIEINDKEDILKELNVFFNIYAETIFHDLAGFSSIANPANAPINDRLLHKHSCYENGKAYFKTEDYDMAEKFFINSIDCYGTNTKCDRTDSCCERRDVRELFYWKGICNFQLDNSAKALIDFNEAIRVESKNDKFLKGAFRKKLALLYDLKMYDEAIKISEDFLGQFPDEESFDFYYAILELSIISNKPMFYDKYLKEIKVNECLTIGNKAILFDYFTSTGEIVFNLNKVIPNGEKELEKEGADSRVGIILDKFFAKTSDFEKRLKQKRNNNDNSLELFTWNFIDMLNWAKERNNENCADILIMTQKMQNIQEQAQNKLLYKEKFTDVNTDKNRK